jgi:hypothetical protein
VLDLSRLDELRENELPVRIRFAVDRSRRALPHGRHAAAQAISKGQQLLPECGTEA